jgi:hypothetical protein
MGIRQKANRSQASGGAAAAVLVSLLVAIAGLGGVFAIAPAAAVETTPCVVMLPPTAVGDNAQGYTRMPSSPPNPSVSFTGDTCAGDGSTPAQRIPIAAANNGDYLFQNWIVVRCRAVLGACNTNPAQGTSGGWEPITYSQVPTWVEDRSVRATAFCRFPAISWLTVSSFVLILPIRASTARLVYWPRSVSSVPQNSLKASTRFAAFTVYSL